MHKFEFKHQQKQWDRYKAFHAHEGPFVEFETGEVLVSHYPRPHERKRYERYGIQLVTTRDKDCPQLYYDEECTKPVKAAWLLQDGQQHLAIDHERKVAVKLSRHRYGKSAPELQYLASHLHGSLALWTGPQRLPVPLAQTTVSTPDRGLVKELQDKLSEVRAAVKAAARIQGITPNPWQDTKWPVAPKWQDWTVERICAYVCADRIIMRTVAFNGFATPRTETKHDFLYIS